LGLTLPDKGQILINTEDIKDNGRYKSHIGYMPQIARFPENLTVAELLRMTKDIRKTPSSEENYIMLFNLEAFRHKKLKNLSGGTKQKVNAILAFMFDPAILIFDEPSVGLDPVSHLKLKNLMRQERERGKTILLTTHILSEVEELADEIIFLMDGKIYFKGSVAELVEAQQENNLERAIARMLLHTEKRSKNLKLSAA
ncbi:MAG: copper-transport ATP-binding protein NosF, partial [Adhaeribacter sp.]|nr:copper-transport ATP-binding protein NosF [Adhaeribacter sp.]